MSLCVLSAPTAEEIAADPHAAHEAEMDPTKAVRLATVGLLVQAVVSFPASAALPYLNRWLGITTAFHVSAILYGAAVCCIGLVNSYFQTLLIMAVCGLALPPIFSSSYILVEVYASEAELESD